MYGRCTLRGAEHAVATGRAPLTAHDERHAARAVIVVSKPFRAAVRTWRSARDRRPAVDAPVGRLGAAVPARVTHGVAPVPTRRDRRTVGRPADPRVAERAVVPRVAVEPGVEANVARGPELGHVRLVAAADQHPAAREHLRVPHRGRDERRRVRIGRRRARTSGLLVEPSRSPRDGCDEVAGAVVEQRERAVGMRPGVVLVEEPRAGGRPGSRCSGRRAATAPRRSCDRACRRPRCSSPR